MSVSDRESGGLAIWAPAREFSDGAYPALIHWAERRNYECLLSVYPSGGNRESEQLHQCLGRLARHLRRTHRRFARPGYVDDAAKRIVEGHWLYALMAPHVNVYGGEPGLYAELRRSVRSLWDWQQPSRPEDLVFREQGGPVRFYTVAHERLAHFALDEEEALDVQREVGLPLVSFGSKLTPAECLPPQLWPETEWGTGS